MTAWSLPGGGVKLGHQEPNTKGRADMLNLPCGNCTGCRMSKAREWALRCHLELLDHNAAAFTTLTYNDESLPPTLRKRDLQLFLKRFRERMGATQPIRFFGCGEYGEKTARPHYHAILFGAHAERDRRHIEESWSLGYTHTVQANVANINYVAGYTRKKATRARGGYELEVDQETGEVLREWQHPFIQMSRRPGIGANARKHTHSWRAYAIHNGTQVPVPRYLHEAWKKQATPEQLEELKLERITRANSKEPITHQRLEAQEQINQARQRRSAEKRTKL